MRSHYRIIRKGKNNKGVACCCYLLRKKEEGTFSFQLFRPPPFSEKGANSTDMQGELKLFFYLFLYVERKTTDTQTDTQGAFAVCLMQQQDNVALREKKRKDSNQNRRLLWK